MEILTVCTGNICRSPLAQVLLDLRLRDLGVAVSSAGIRGLDAAPMTPEAIDLALHLGVSEAAADAHRSRYLTEGMLATPDLILTATREHRRGVAELAPSRLRSTFTMREFARLAETLDDETLRAAADAAGADPSARLRAAGATVAGRRGVVPAATPADSDDVIDPYRRPWEVYIQSANELVPALGQVERVVRLTAAD